MSNAKKMSIKSIDANIEKNKAEIEKKKKSIEALNKEIKEAEAKIKEYTAEKEELQREQAFTQLKTVLGSGSISADKLTKLTEVISTISKEKLDAEDVMTALNMVIDEKKQGGKL